MLPLDAIATSCEVLWFMPTFFATILVGRLLWVELAKLGRWFSIHIQRGRDSHTQSPPSVMQLDRAPCVDERVDEQLADDQQPEYAVQMRAHCGAR